MRIPLITPASNNLPPACLPYKCTHECDNSTFLPGLPYPILIRMSLDIDSFESITELKKFQVHYNHYNVFHILERKRLLLAKAREVAAANNGDEKADPVDSIAEQTELDETTMAFKMYHSLSLPPLPPRYHELNLPPHWFIDIVHNQTKRRIHRKSHGLIPFKELAKLIADNHKTADYETREWCHDVATKIIVHNHTIQEDFTKAQRKKKIAEAKQSTITKEMLHSQLASRMNPSITSLPSSKGDHRHSVVDTEDEQILQAYKLVLERERLKHMDLERSMSMASSGFHPDRMVRAGYSMYQNNPYRFMSAPVSGASISSMYDTHRPHMGIQFGRSAQAAGQASFPPAEVSDDDERIKRLATMLAANSKSDENTDNLTSSFMLILHEIVDDPKTDDIVHWLPCGTIFNIADKKEFTKQLIPKFQQGQILGDTNTEKFKSFKSNLKRLNFEKITLKAYTCAYKKEGFIKIQAATATPIANGSERSTSLLRQLDLYASVNKRAQMMKSYPYYPRRTSLPGMDTSKTYMMQSRIGQDSPVSRDMMIGYYQGLAAANAPLPFEMMQGRRLSMPTSSDPYMKSAFQSHNLDAIRGRYEEKFLDKEENKAK